MEIFQFQIFTLGDTFRIAPMFYVGILAYTLMEGFSPTYWTPNGVKWWFIPITATFLHGFNPETINSIVP